MTKSTATSTSNDEPLLVRRRTRAVQLADSMTLDEVMPYAVSGARVLQMATKETRVNQETTDDD